MNLICCDMEGVFTPEIWINVAEKTGIEKLRITTRDEPDYDKLMKYRIEILEKNNITLADIQKVIGSLELLPGAKDFLEWLKEQAPTVIVSDTFTQFADPLMAKLGRPTLFCNKLDIDDRGMIVGHIMRQDDQKRKVIDALHSLNYKIVSFGDSYNDVTMLKQADYGVLFKPPKNVVSDYPDFPVTNEYEELKKEILKGLETLQ